MNIRITLRDIGLNDKEIAVYLALFQGGDMTPAALAKATKINRATVYNVAQALQSKGIVAEDASRGKRLFSALPPESLRQIVEAPMRELREKETNVESAIDELSRIAAGKTYPVPKIRFVEEARVEDFLYANIEKWAESAKRADGVLWGFQDGTFLEQHKKFIDWYWKQPVSRELKMHMIGNETPVEKELLRRVKHSTRDVRFAPDLPFTASVWAGGDYLIMVVTNQSPQYLVENCDAALASNMREVFKRFWSEFSRQKS